MNTKSKATFRPRARHGVLGAVWLLALVLGGCVIAPPEAKREQAAMLQAGAPYRARFDERTLPVLPEAPEWRDVLHRAFLANGELEAAYDDWAAAVWRVQQAGAWPNTNLALG